ncbi:hypothetical protein [Bradyrhizobium sp. ISRA463]|nr:hypothetical protein [Bradyrhizobium sp. ISRA463]
MNHDGEPPTTADTVSRQLARDLFHVFGYVFFAIHAVGPSMNG